MTQCLGHELGLEAAATAGADPTSWERKPEKPTQGGEKQQTEKLLLLCVAPSPAGCLSGCGGSSVRICPPRASGASGASLGTPVQRHPPDRHPCSTCPTPGAEVSPLVSQGDVTAPTDTQ